MFNLLALVLDDFLTNDPNGDLNKYIASLSVEKVIKDKREKIESADELWENITKEVGAKHAAMIIPILKGE